MAGPTLQPGQLRVRMYRVGFGDCFLVSLPQACGHAHILVDCGVHSRGRVGDIADSVKNIAAETGGRLDVIVATHAHQDHIAGFDVCDDAFAAMSVGEVWLPWTEDPDDAQAARISKKQQSLTQALALHLAARGAGGNQEAIFMVENAKGNANALRLLKSGVNGGKVRYIEAGQSLEEPAGIKRLNVRFLGPPRDETFLSKMDPPAGDRYFRMGDYGSPVAVNAAQPFPFALARNSVPEMLRLKPAEEKAMRDQAENLDSLAFTIDSALNNSSVVALFAFAGQRLLFPGDAQYGNWSAWMNGPDASDILAGLDFMKISHHGSLNATPKRAVEGLTEGKVATMASTQDTPWGSIPREPLMQAIEAKTHGRSVRSDSIPLAGAPEGPHLDHVPDGFVQGDFWFDYIVETVP